MSAAEKASFAANKRLPNCEGIETDADFDIPR